MKVGMPIATLFVHCAQNKQICLSNYSKNVFSIQNHLNNRSLRPNILYKEHILSVSSFKTKYDEKRFKSKSLYEKLIQFRVLTIPNLLTGSRIVMTPILSYLIIHEHHISACTCFALAGFTDLLDGYIARTFPSQMSDIGSFIDPLADKFLISSLFITLTYVHLIPAALMCLVVTRDIILTGAGFYIRYVSLEPRPSSLKEYFDPSNRSVALSPTLISKINTALQLCLVGVTLGAPIFSYVDHQYLNALWYATAFMTLASGVSYIFAKDTIRVVRKKREHYKHS